MADADTEPPPTTSNKMHPVASNSGQHASIVVTEQTIAPNPKSSSRQTPNDNDSRAESDFVQMMNLIMEDPAVQNVSSENRLSAKDSDSVQITVPQGRVSRKNRHGHGRRRGGSSMMGDKTISVRLNIPETVIDEENSTSLKVEREHSAQSADHSNPGSDLIERKETLELLADPIHELVEILKKSAHDRSKNEIEILVNYFEDFQIMGADVDQWSGQHTFRALISKAKYKRLKKNNFVYKREDHDETQLCFYFILKGTVQLSESDDDEIISLTEHDIFGDEEMYTLEPRQKNCIVHSPAVHLAYWAKDAYNDYIRPIKELNTNIKQEKGLLHDKYGNLLTESDLIEKASMFLDDAIHGRSFKMHRNGKWPRKVHRLLIDKYFRYFIISICLLWLLIVFVEPPSSLVDNAPDTTQYRYIMPCIAFEWLVFVIFLVECLARVFSYGSRWFFTNQLHVYRVVLLVIFLIDLSIATALKGEWFRFSRLFRPFYLMLFVRDLRRQYFILMSCIPSVLELIMLYLAVVGIFARIGYHIFDHTAQIYNRDEFLQGTGVYSEYLDGTPGSEDSLYVGIWESFSTFFLSAMTLFVLLTTENYPEVFWPAWLSQHIYFGYFVIYILISTFFLMNLFSASVYNAYQNIIVGLDVFDEGREATALRVAWNCLDYDEKGYIEKDRFVKLMKRLKPHYSPFEIDVLFKLMDCNGDGEIEVLEFSEMMINCLYFSISKRSKSREDELKLYLQRLGARLGPYGYDILSAFTSRTYSHVVLLIVSLDVCFLLSYHFSPTICNYGDALCLCIIVLNIGINIIFKHQSKVRRYFETTKNKIFFIITVIQCIGTVVGIVGTRANREPSYVSGLRFIGISRVLLMASFLRERFSFLKHSTSNTLTQTVIYMIPIFLRICFYLYVGFLYIFTVVGMELFFGWGNRSMYGQSRCNGIKQMDNDPAAMFCDASATFITLFQILTTNNWHTIMYEAIDATDSYFVSLYFISFFVAGPILTVNFLLAVFFHMFFGVSSHYQDIEEQENLKDALLDAAQQKEIPGPHHPHHAPHDRDAPHKTLYSIQSPDGSELPTEPGISSLSDGTRILTVSRETIMQNHADIRIVNGGDRFVHLTLMSVAKNIWERIQTQDYTDANGNVYHHTFTGKAAVECILSLRYAPDEEDAIDYLAQIMDHEAVFSRIVEHEALDTRAQTRANEFANGENMHYQWIMKMGDDDLDDADMMKQEEILIGVRHSYGGFQRLMKANRRVGTANANTTSVLADNGSNTTAAANEMIKSTTTMFSDSETTRNVQTPKKNVFSTRNLLSFQQQQTDTNANTNTNRNANRNTAQDGNNSAHHIKNGLMIVVGALGSETQSITAFEQNYNFAVIHADTMASLTVSKYFNIDKYDGIIVIAGKVTHGLNLKTMYRLLTKKLNVKHIEKIPKLVIYIQDEFGNENEDEKEDDGDDDDDDDAFDEDKEEMLELFGLIETSDVNFSKQFVNHLNNNKESPQSIVVLINKVRTLIENNICLNHFDPRLLLYQITPNQPQ